jgi:hypothetical protein
MSANTMVSMKVPVTESARRSRPALELLRAALGPSARWPEKIGKVGGTLASWARIMRDADGLARRLAPLRQHGLVDAIPTRLQLLVGSLDMLRFWISPAAADYYARQGISFTFHQILRVLDDPAAMLDPVGFFVDRDAVIGHLLQVVHANPIYDVQLLSTHEGGLEALEAQTREVIAGTHPRARSIAAIVEEPDYHARLLAFVAAYREDPRAAPPVRSNIAGKFDLLERTFGSLPAAMRYFSRLPTDLVGAVRHLVGVRTFPEHLAEVGDGATR